MSLSLRQRPLLEIPGLMQMAMQMAMRMAQLKGETENCANIENAPVMIAERIEIANLIDAVRPAGLYGSTERRERRPW